MLQYTVDYDLGEIAWEPLQLTRPQHFLTLREFILNESGPVIQRLLCSMPNLEDLEVVLEAWDLSFLRPGTCRS